MLFALADDVGFKLKGGRRFDCPKSACLLYDESGASWPKDSLLITRIPSQGRPATDDETRGTPGWWLGDSYEAQTSMVRTPPRALASWKLVGDVEQIFYDRIGDKYPGQFHHTFNKTRGLWHVVAWIKGKQDVKVYKRAGGVFRVELGTSATLRDVGLVWP